MKRLITAALLCAMLLTACGAQGNEQSAGSIGQVQQAESSSQMQQADSGEYSSSSEGEKFERPAGNVITGKLVEIEEDGFMNINLLPPPVIHQEHPLSEHAVSLDGYEGEDPFHETDLPIDMG